MKKLSLLLLIACISVFALDKITIPRRASSGAVITASHTNENLDTIANKFNKAVDSIVDLRDSIGTRIFKGDSIRLTGYSSSDSIYAEGGKIDTLTSGKGTFTQVDINGGTVDGVIIGGASAQAATFTTITGTGTSTIDSLVVTKQVRSAGLNSSGTATVDSLKSAKGIVGTTGTFSGTASVDSLKSTKGINATTGTFSGRIAADSLFSTKGIAGATVNTGNGNFEIGQNLRSTDAVTFTTVNTGQGNVECYAQDQNLRTTDDVTFDSVYATKFGSEGTFPCTLSGGGGGQTLQEQLITPK